MKVYKVGVVGSGLATQNMHLPVISNMSRVKLTWLTDVDETNGQLVADSYGIDFVSLKNGIGALPDCDVVLLSIPLAPRSAYYKHFGANGVAVLAEKPFALSHKEHVEFQSLFNIYSAGCGYQRRFFAPNMMLKRIVTERWFGCPKKITINVGARSTKTGVDSTYQDLSTAEGGGALINLGCHLIDLGFFILSATDYKLKSYELEFDGLTDRKATGVVDIITDTEAFGLCEFEFCVSWLDYQSNSVELEFEKIKLVASFSVSDQIKIISLDTGISNAFIRPVNGMGAITSNQAFYLQWEEFLNGIDNQSESMIAASTTQLTARLMDEILHDG